MIQQQDLLADEVKKFRLLLADLMSPDSRRNLIRYLEKEGVSASGLTKSIVFDLTVGAAFGLVGAHLSFARGQSRNYLKSLASKAAVRILAWTEKLLTRSVRSSLTQSKQATGSIRKWLENLQENLKDFVEALVE